MVFINSIKFTKFQTFLNEKSFINSLDMRAGMSEKPKRWSDDAVFGGRAYFVFENEPGKLTVEKLQANDAGVYRCRVDFLRAQTYNSRLRLDIISKLPLNM